MKSKNNRWEQQVVFDIVQINSLSSIMQQSINVRSKSVKTHKSRFSCGSKNMNHMNLGHVLKTISTMFRPLPDGYVLKSIKTRHRYFGIENTTWFFAVFPPCWCENRRLTHDPTMRRNCWQQRLFVWTAGPRSKCMQFTCQLNEKMKLPPTWLCLSSLCRCHETAMIPAMCMELSRITKVSHSSSMGVGLNPPIAHSTFLRPHLHQSRNHHLQQVPIQTFLRSLVAVPLKLGPEAHGAELQWFCSCMSASSVLGIIIVTGTCPNSRKVGKHSGHRESANIQISHASRVDFLIGALPCN